MARAFEPVVLARVIHGTREVSAFLAVAHMLTFGRSHKDAMVIFRGIGKQLYSSDRNFSQTRNRLLRIYRGFRKYRAQQNPEIADEHAETGEHEELRQLPAGDVAFVGCANRELFLPQRFATRSSQPFHAVPPTYSPPRPKRLHPAP